MTRRLSGFGFSSRFVLLWVASLALLGATGVPSCDRAATVYGLTLDTEFLEGCFAPLACRVELAEGIGGTFRLTKLSAAQGDPVEHFLVSDLHWLVRLGHEDVRITGGGIYERGGEVALQQRMELDLQIGDRQVQHFDSGLIAPTSEFPDIGVRISIHGEQSFDTVIDLHAAPFEKPARAAAAPTAAG